MVASTPMSAILEAPPAIDNLYGAYLLGTFVSLVYVVSSFARCTISYPRRHSLYGVSLHQLYLYARTSKTDTALIRSLVSASLIVLALHSNFLVYV